LRLARTKVTARPSLKNNTKTKSWVWLLAKHGRGPGFSPHCKKRKKKVKKAMLMETKFLIPSKQIAISGSLHVNTKYVSKGILGATFR
jgi:hypothetical protein